MATDYYQDDENKKKRRGGQGNKGRQPGSTGAPQTPKKPSNGGSKSSTSNGGVDVKGALKVGIALSKSLANASDAKKYRDAGISAFKGTPVKANEEMPKGMDVSVTDSYNMPRTGDDMGQMDHKERKKKYGF